MSAQPISVSAGGGLTGRRSAASQDVVRPGEPTDPAWLAGPGVPLEETAGGLSQDRPCPTFSDRRFRWPPSPSQPDRNAGKALWLDRPRILRSVASARCQGGTRVSGGMACSAAPRGGCLER